MIMTRNLFFAILLFFVFIIMFSLIPNHSWLRNQHDLPVFQPILHSSHDVVQFLANHSFTMKIKKVHMEGLILNIDFLINEIDPDKEIVYMDLKKIIFEGFNQFSSLDHIRVRVLYRQYDEDQLLLGIIASKSQYKPNEIRDNWSIEKVITYMDDHFQVTYGPIWKDQNNSHHTQ